MRNKIRILGLLSLVVMVIALLFPVTGAIAEPWGGYPPYDPGPSVTSYSPTPGSSGVAINTNLVINFNENVQKGSGYIRIHKFSDPDMTAVQTIDVNSAQVSITDAVVTINPADLDPNTHYYIHVDAGAIEDVSHNDWSGIPYGDKTTWTFTTIAADTTPPSVNSFSPLDNATGVEINTNLVITFSENIKVGTGGGSKNLYIKRSSDSVAIQTIGITSGMISGAVLTIDPSDLAYNTDYYIGIDNGAIMDIAGNAYTGINDSSHGISNTYIWNFKTKAAPVLTTINVSPTNPNVPQGTTQTYTAQGVDQYSNPISAGTITWSVSNPTAGGINSSSGLFTAGTTVGSYTDVIIATSGSVHGHASVTVTDVTAPTATFIPTDGATGVSISVVLTMNFSEWVTCGTGQKIIIWDITNNNKFGGDIPTNSANVHFSADHLSVTIDHASFAYNTHYCIKIETGAFHDASGNNYAGWDNQTTWDFYTGTAPAVLDHIVITPANPDVPLHGTVTYTASGVDQYGNPFALGTLTWSCTNPSAGSINSTTGVFIADSIAGSYTDVIIATSGTVHSHASVHVIAYGALDHVTISPDNPSVAQGATQTYTVKGYDLWNNEVPLVSKAWSCTNPTAGGINASTGLFTAGTAGYYANVISVTADGKTDTASVTVTDVTPPTATYSPNHVMDVSINTQLVITFNENIQKGLFGNVYVHSPFDFIFPTYTIPINSAAVQIVNNVMTITLPGPLAYYTHYWITVDDFGAIQDMAGNWWPGITYFDTLSWEFWTGTNPTPVVTTVVVTPDAHNVPVNGNYTYSATGYDQYANEMSGLTFTWTVSGGGSIASSGPKDGTFTAGTTPGGPYTVTATCGAVHGTALVAVIAYGALQHVTISPDGSNIAVNGHLTYSVTGYDMWGNNVPLSSIAWDVTDPTAGVINASSGYFTAGTTVSPFDGVIHVLADGMQDTASVNVIAHWFLDHVTIAPDNPNVPVNGHVTYSVTGYDEWGNIVPLSTIVWNVTNPTAGSINGASGDFTAGITVNGYTDVIHVSADGFEDYASVNVIAHGDLSYITVDPATAQLAVGGTLQFHAIAHDVYGNTWDITTSVTWTVNAGGTINFGGTLGLFKATATGTSTITATLISAGTIRFVAVDPSGTATVTVIEHGALDHIIVTPDGVTLPIHATQQYTATAYDSLGNWWNITNEVAWTAGGGTIDANGLYTAVTPGVGYTVTATEGAIHGSVLVNVIAHGNLVTITINPFSANVPVTQTQQYIATGNDTFGNTWDITTSSNWSVSGGGNIGLNTGLFTAGTVAGGPYTVTATWGAVSGTAAVTVVAGALNHINVSPTTATVAVHGGIQLYIAQGYDIYNNPISGLTYSWSVIGGLSVGSIDATGLFSAGNIAGTYPGVIMATSGLISGSASVTILPGALNHITVSPSNPTVLVTGTQQYTAQAFDQYGNILGEVITWSVSNATAGSINAGSGLFTAGTVVGSYSNVIVATSGLISGYASVTVATSGVAGRIVVTPDTSSLNVNGTQQYTAQAYDPYNNPISMTFTWSVTNGTAGSINVNTGLFTAGTVAGSYTGVIMASAGGMSGTASVTVLAGVLASIVITPDPTSLPVGGTQQFNAQGLDQYGNPIVMTFTWNITDGTAGSINASGLFTAGTNAGTFDGLIQASSGGLSGAASVTLTTEANIGPEIIPTETQNISGPVLDNGSNWWWWLIISVIAALLLLFLMLVIGRRKKKAQNS
jgi:hypothetical protein